MDINKIKYKKKIGDFNMSHHSTSMIGDPSLKEFTDYIGATSWNVLDNFGKSDITYNLNFFLLKKIVKKLNLKVVGLTSQKNFLTKLGILDRAEILAKNLQFSKKADIYYRLKRLIDEKQMGNIFKVMLIKNRKNEFNLGFGND